VGRGEVQDRGDAGGDQPVAHLLGGGGGGGDDADRHLLLLDDAVQVVDVVDGELVQLLADLVAVGVEQGGDAEAALGEAPVVGQGAAEVADPDDRHRPVLLQAELAADLVDEVLDVVADAPGAVGAEVGQVLAYLGRVHPGGVGELVGGDPVGAPLRHVDQAAEVHGQAGDGRFRNTVSHGLPPPSQARFESRLS
jgi:hypothetical protein